MSLFDEIVKTVDKTIEPGLESLTQNEIGGISVNGDFDVEEDPMVGMAMEAMGKDVQYDADSDPDAAGYSDKDIEELSKAGAEDEDEDDDYSEETIGELLDGFVEAVYGDPEDEDPTEELSDEDLEDIDDDFDEGMEGTGLGAAIMSQLKKASEKSKDAKELKREIARIQIDKDSKSESKALKNIGKNHKADFSLSSKEFEKKYWKQYESFSNICSKAERDLEESFPLCRRYLENIDKFLDAGEYSKASILFKACDPEFEKISAASHNIASALAVVKDLFGDDKCPNKYIHDRYTDFSTLETKYHDQIVDLKNQFYSLKSMVNAIAKATSAAASYTAGEDIDDDFDEGMESFKQSRYPDANKKVNESEKLREVAKAKNMSVTGVDGVGKNLEHKYETIIKWTSKAGDVLGAHIRKLEALHNDSLDDVIAKRRREGIMYTEAIKVLHDAAERIAKNNSNDLSFGKTIHFIANQQSFESYKRELEDEYAKYKMKSTDAMESAMNSATETTVAEGAMESAREFINSQIEAFEEYLGSLDTGTNAKTMDEVYPLYAGLLDARSALEAVSEPDEKSVEKEIAIYKQWIKIYGSQAVTNPSSALEKMITDLKNRIARLEEQRAKKAAPAAASATA